MLLGGALKHRILAEPGQVLLRQRSDEVSLLLIQVRDRQVVEDKVHLKKISLLNLKKIMIYIYIQFVTDRFSAPCQGPQWKAGAVGA